MGKYRIESLAGVDHGTWIGDTPGEALARMHQAAGYDVRLLIDRRDGERLLFASDEDAEICGGLDKWHVVAALT